MTTLEAIKARHSVRKYSDKPIESAKVETLRVEIEKANAESGNVWGFAGYVAISVIAGVALAALGYFLVR